MRESECVLVRVRVCVRACACVRVMCVLVFLSVDSKSVRKCERARQTFCALKSESKRYTHEEC